MGQVIDPNSLLVRTDQQAATPTFFNNLITAFCLAINSIGVRMDGYDVAEQNLVSLGLANINAVLGPFLITLQEAAQLGFLVGEAALPVPKSLTVGQQFDVALTNQGASLFTPTTWLTVMDVNDSTNWGLLQLISWVQQDLNLSTMCIYASKTQLSNNWQVVCGAGVLPETLDAMNAAAASAASAANSLAALELIIGPLNALAAEIASGPVSSVAGKTGNVTLVESDIAGLVADLTARPLSTFVTSQLAGKQNSSTTLTALAALTYSAFMLAFLGSQNAPAAMITLGAAPLASPVFTGTPTAPTPPLADNSNTLATTAYVQTSPTPSTLITAVFNDLTGNYTFTNADSGKMITFSGAATATLPSNLPKGWNCLVYQAGNAAVTFHPASGATLRNRLGATSTAGQYAVVSLLVVSNTSNLNAVIVLGGDAA